MQKQILRFNEASFNSTLRGLKGAELMFNEIGQALKNAGIDASKVTLTDLLNDTEAELLAFLPDETQKIARLVDAPVRMPDAFKIVVDLAKRTRASLDNIKHPTYAGEYYAFSPEGEPVLIQAKLDALKESVTQYIVNDREQQRFDLASEICAVLQKFQDAPSVVLPEKFSPFSSEPFNALNDVISFENGKFRVRTGFVKKMNR